MRLLGWLARSWSWGGRSEKLVRPPVLLLALSLWTALYGLSDLLEARANPGGPRELPVQSLFDADSRPDYLRVSGRLAAGVEFRQGEDRYLAWQAAQGPETVLLRLPRQDYPPPPAGTLAVEGTMHFLPLRLADQLPADTGARKFYRDQYLMVGERPPSSAIAWILLALGTGASLPLLLVVSAGGVIFRPAAAPEKSGKSAEKIAAKLTGRLWKEKSSRDFFDAKAALRRRDSNLELTVTESDSESWSLELTPEQLTKIEAGTLFLGKEERPALRLRVVFGRRRSRLTLSFSDRASWESAWSLITSSSAETP